MMLDMNALPLYCESAFRSFYKHEHHVSRIFDRDVLIIGFGGILRFEENDTPVSVHTGEYYIQRRGLVQTGKSESDLPRYYYIHFHGKFRDDGRGLPLKGTVDTERIMPLIDRLHASEVGSSTAVEKHAHFYNILSEIMSSRDNADDISTRAAKYISENAASKISLSEVSDRLGYTEDYIIRQFKKRYGVTPHEYLIDLRINNAKQLLITTDRSVSAIAYECGYSDVAAFYKAFSKRTGQSPTEYRKNCIMGMF